METSSRQPSLPNRHALSRTRAWELSLLCRLNVKYWRIMLDRKRRANRIAQFAPVAAGTLGGVVVKLWGYPWLQAGIPPVVGLVGGPLLSLLGFAQAVWRFRAYFQRWSELCHDAEDLWTEGETCGWGGTRVGGTLERLKERERLYHSQEYDKPVLHLLDQCQRELWTELGQAYD